MPGGEPKPWRNAPALHAPARRALDAGRAFFEEAAGPVEMGLIRFDLTRPGLIWLDLVLISVGHLFAWWVSASVAFFVDSSRRARAFWAASPSVGEQYLAS